MALRSAESAKAIARFAIIALAVAAGAFTPQTWMSPALAQHLPLPGPSLPGQPPQSPLPEKADCSEAGVKAMQLQLEQLESIEKSGPETIGLFCKGIETLSSFMEWKDDEPLPGVINDLAKDLLHQDLTPRMVKSICRHAQGEAARNFRTEMGKLKDQMAGCKGI